MDSLAVTYLPASPIPGVPTGFNKMTGVAYSSIIELGFVGPQLRMAVSLLQAGLAQGSRVQGNASLVAQAVAMLDAWVNATGPGFGHAVWDMQVCGFAAQATRCGDSCCVLLRVAVCCMAEVHACFVCIAMSYHDEPPRPARHTITWLLWDATSNVSAGAHSRVRTMLAVLCCAVLCHLASFTIQETASNAVPRSGAALGHWVDDGTAPDGQGVVYLRRVVESHRHALEAAALATQYCTGT